MKKAIILVFTFCCLISGCTIDDFEEKEIIVDREITVEEKNIADEKIVIKDNEADRDTINEQSVTEEKVSIEIDTDNPYFFHQSLLTASAKYFSITEGKEIEETINAEVSLVKTYEEGDVYKFTIDLVSDYFSTWYIQGGEPISMYFYVTADKIYLISRYVQAEPDGFDQYFWGGDELITEIFDTDERLVNNSIIVCQEEEIKDNAETGQYFISTNNKENEHYFISQNGNQIFCYYYQLKANGDLLYRDKFLWEKGKGLVVYLTGYGVGDYDIYLDGITGGGLAEQEGMMLESTVSADGSRLLQYVDEGQENAPVNGNRQYSFYRFGDGYVVVLYDKDGQEVYSLFYPREPWIAVITDTVWQIGINLNGTAEYVFYFNTETAELSDTYLNSILFGDKYVAYMEDDITDAENAILILVDLFQEGILYQEITRNFSIMTDPMSAVISVEMINGSSIRLEYYKGDEMEIVSEIIELNIA